MLNYIKEIIKESVSEYFMIKRIRKLFTEHPGSVNESYLKHMWFAVRYSLQLGLCFGAAMIHAFFPFLFTTYCSKKVEYLNKWVKTRD